MTDGTTNNPTLPEWEVTSFGSQKVVRAETPVAALRRALGQNFADDAPVSKIDDLYVYPLESIGQAGNAVVRAVPAEEEREEQEEVIPVVLAVHNGAVQDGQLLFANKYYALPLSVLAKIQEVVSEYEIV